MGQCIDRLPHSCGTREGLQVFVQEDGSVDGYCFVCSTYVRHPYGHETHAKDINVKIKTPEEIQAEIAEISGYQCLDLPHRKLRKESLEFYGVRVGVKEEDGVTPEAVYFPYKKNGRITGYKVKLIEKVNGKKKIWSVGDTKDCDLFGWDLAILSGARRLIITEGEEDAIALRRSLERHTSEEWKDRIPAVVSLTSGAGSAKREITKHLKDINRLFKEVVLCFDMDEPGRKAVEEVCSIIPNALSIELPYKDANECVMEGKSKELYRLAVFTASVPKNTRLVMGEDIHDKSREEPKFGELTWPWKKLNETTRGIRYGSTIYIGAGVKMGKSEVLNAIAAHFIKVHGVKVFMAKPEEDNKKTYKLMAGKIMGKFFHDPKKLFDQEAFDKAGEIMRGKLAMVDLYQHMGWTTLQQDIYAAIAWGAKAIFIDPITNITNGVNAAEANTMLQDIAQNLASIAHDHNVVIFIFCHLKAPDGNISKEERKRHYSNGKYTNLGNCPHELGGDISSVQFAGSRSMMRSCHMMIGIEGNKDETLPNEVRNIRTLRILEDREFGEVGSFPIWWNPDTSLFGEM